MGRGVQPIGRLAVSSLRLAYTIALFFSFSFSSNDLNFIVLGRRHEKTEELRILGEATAGGAWSWRLAVTA